MLSMYMCVTCTHKFFSKNKYLCMLFSALAKRALYTFNTRNMIKDPLVWIDCEVKKRRETKKREKMTKWFLYR